AEADARLDLRAANLSVAEAGWNKAPDVPGRGRLILDLANEQITRLREIEVRTAGLYGKFSLSLTPDREYIERIDIERLLIGDDDSAGHCARRAGGGWRIILHAPPFDLTYWLNAPGNDRLPHHPPTAPPLLIDARLDRLILGPRRQLRD